MPFVQITLMHGRSVEQKHELIRRLTDAVVDSLGSDPERVRVAIYEVSPDEWGIGGVPAAVLRPNG